jgi:ABC-type dipeptide/oligopeptide/nickel transport system permease component
MFVSDSYKILAVAVAVTTFLWFKNLDIPYNKLINIIGGTTFGVLLIHANSNAMRQWLWKDTVDCVGHYALPLPQLMLYSIAVVLAVFFTCSVIDRLRQVYIEEPFFKWYDRKNLSQRIREKCQTLPIVSKLIQDNE